MAGPHSLSPLSPTAQRTPPGARAPEGRHGRQIWRADRKPLEGERLRQEGEKPMTRVRRVRKREEGNRSPDEARGFYYLTRFFWAQELFISADAFNRSIHVFRLFLLFKALYRSSECFWSCSATLQMRRPFHGVLCSRTGLFT